MWFSVLAVAFLVMCALGAWFIATVRRIARPTTGAPIAADAAGEALLVIDMQEDFTRSEGPHAYGEERRNRAVVRINELVSKARSAGQAVVYIRQQHKGWAIRLAADMLLGGAGNPGRPGARLDRDVDAAGFPDLLKHVGDAFSNPELDRLLRQENVGLLRLTGLDLAHCVTSTALGARNRGYGVVIDLDGSLAADEKAWARQQQRLAAAGVATCRQGEEPHLAGQSSDAGKSE
ncbi:cysteine hydrolase family protein [Stappia sp. ICDLI1TA098]